MPAPRIEPWSQKAKATSFTTVAFLIFKLCSAVFFLFLFFSFSTMSLTFGYLFQLLKNMKEDVLNKNVLHVVGDKTI